MVLLICINKSLTCKIRSLKIRPEEQNLLTANNLVSQFQDSAALLDSVKMLLSLLGKDGEDKVIIKIIQAACD